MMENSESLNRVVLSLGLYYIFITWLTSSSNANNANVAVTVYSWDGVQWNHWRRRSKTPPCWRYIWYEQKLMKIYRNMNIFMPRLRNMQRPCISTLCVILHNMQFAIIRKYITNHVTLLQH